MDKAKAIWVKEQFLSDFEKSYGYEKEAITGVSSLPPHCIADLPDFVREEIRQKVVAACSRMAEVIGVSEVQLRFATKRQAVKNL